MMTKKFIQQTVLSYVLLRISTHRPYFAHCVWLGCVSHTPKKKAEQYLLRFAIVLLIYFSGHMPANMLLHAGCLSRAFAIVSERGGHCHIIIKFSERRNMIRVINENIAINSISSRRKHTRSEEVFHRFSAPFLSSATIIQKKKYNSRRAAVD